MTVQIDAVTAVEVTAETPGDMAGSAVQIDVSVINQSPEAQSVDSAVVSVTTDSSDIGIATNAGGPEPFSGQVDPGGSVSGRYVFLLDDPVGRVITISVNYSAGEPVAAFTGQVP